MTATPNSPGQLQATTALQSNRFYSWLKSRNGLWPLAASSLPETKDIKCFGGSDLQSGSQRILG